ncbi:MAG: hypothetical protein ACLSHC_18090 [Bilophila wadsworthia]
MKPRFSTPMMRRRAVLACQWVILACNASSTIWEGGTALTALRISLTAATEAGDQV